MEYGSGSEDTAAAAGPDVPDAATQPQRIIVTSTKNVGLAVGLALFLGPLGMCYSTLKGALVMFLVNIVIAVLTLGFGCLITLPFCAIWAYMAAKKYNEQLFAEQQ